MSLQLYDLAGAEPQRRFSPYCWRTKLALAHKCLAVETIPWRFTDKDVIGFSGQGRVPVLVDGDKVVSDSWAIATSTNAFAVASPIPLLPARRSRQSWPSHTNLAAYSAFATTP